MASYDRSYTAPKWWLDELGRVMRQNDWDNPAVIREAKRIDGRGKSWGPDRISKMFNGENATLELVLAISSAVDIPAPFFEASSVDEAREFQQFRRRRQVVAVNPDQRARLHAVDQVLEAAVNDAKDQTRPVESPNEGSPRDPRTRRAPRGR